MTAPALPKRVGSSQLKRWFVIAIPYLWLAFFFLAPFFIVLKISLSDTTIAQPPYEPLLDLANGWQGVKDWWAGLDFENYGLLFDDELYWRSYLSSLEIAGVSTLIALAIAYPMAYAMARAPKTLRPTLLMLVILPFWTSLLIRVYAWIGILNPEGLMNQFLLWTGIISEPIYIMNTETAVYIGIVYSYLPFMILPLYSSLEKLDDTLLEAASDLGSPPWKSFWQITVPLSLPGVIAGCFLVFIPAVGEFVIPDLLGGSETLMIGKTLYNEFFLNRDWPVSSALAVLLLLVLVVPIAVYNNVQAKELGSAK
ncbi:ABC transporter permease [Chenggangzhangella methanolivorans]|uniref:ABC transporter permease n=1 Tax=Chenggangzhangella methanolivorans TaxID=1437009 RepID=UPI00361CE4C0